MRKFSVLIPAALCISAASLAAQSDPLPSFDVASVKPNKSDNPPTVNFPIGPGDAYTPTGGYFNATNLPLISYIAFAYKLVGNQLQSLLDKAPGWVTTERFDIQARASGTPGKDQMRMLMRSLLADRFKLVVREEVQQISVAALTMAKEGKLGPNIQPHPADVPCPLDAPPADISPDPRFPLLCGGLLQMQASESSRLRFAARNVTIDFISKTLSRGSSLGRPMVDRTGLAGKFDFTLEWTPDTQLKPGEEQPERSGPTFEKALREQLGFKLEAQKAGLPVMVIAHVERPTEN